MPNEVNINKIDFSEINYNDNKPFCYINYNNNNSNESLFLQTPNLKFIEPIVTQQNVKGSKFNILYLFLSPQDPTTSSFIDLISKIETKSCNHINSVHSNNVEISSVIKSYDLDEGNNQVVKYLKVTLLNNTKIEYNNKIIGFNELDQLVNKVNLKLIFEINMLWISQTKLGIYLKPIKIKACDIIKELEFRDDDDILSPHDIVQTEVDHINRLFTNNSLQSFNDSVFNTDINKNKYNIVSDRSEINLNDNGLDNFIKINKKDESNKINKINKIKDESNEINYQNELKNQLINLKKTSDNNNKNNDSPEIHLEDSDSLSSSSSSIRLDVYTRKPKGKKSNELSSKSNDTKSINNSLNYKKNKKKNKKKNNN